MVRRRARSSTVPRTDSGLNAVGGGDFAPRPPIPRLVARWCCQPMPPMTGPSSHLPPISGGAPGAFITTRSCSCATFISRAAGPLPPMAPIRRSCPAGRGAQSILPPRQERSPPVVQQPLSGCARRNGRPRSQLAKGQSLGRGGVRGPWAIFTGRRHRPVP
jgi:hypothetical protein